MDFTRLVGNTAVVCTIASNFAGVSVCLDISRRGSTSGISSLPFLSAAITTLLWLQYGMRTGDGVLLMVNAISVFVQCSYLTYYCCRTRDKLTIMQRIISAAVFLLSLHVYTFYIVKQETSVQILGLLSSFGSIAVSAAPLALIKEVFQTRSTQKLPFPIIFSTFVVNSLWFTYGVLISDTFVKVPNFIAALLCAIQLGLFLIFDSHSPQLKKD